MVWSLELGTFVLVSPKDSLDVFGQGTLLLFLFLDPKPKKVISPVRVLVDLSHSSLKAAWREFAKSLWGSVIRREVPLACCFTFPSASFRLSSDDCGVPKLWL